MDEQAKLEQILTVMPLLVQAAYILFLVGLVLQSITDDQTIGHVLLAFFLFGGAIHIRVSVFSLINPASPFSTPISDFVLWIKKFFVALRSGTLSSRKNSPSTDENEVLAQILYTKLIKSSKSEHVDEAAAEIALPSFNVKWIAYLSRNESPQVLLNRFSTLTKTNYMNRSNAILRNHLLVFLVFVEQFEKRLVECEDKMKDADKVEDVEDVILHYHPLLDSLLDSLKPSHPIHRWNNLHEALQPLLLGLRTQILIFLQSRIPENHSLLRDYVPPGFDLHPNEIADRPWMMAFKDICSHERLYMTLSACRGVLQGNKNLKDVSVLILSLCLAKAGCSAVETGSTSEWAGAVTSSDRKSVEDLTVQFLCKFFRTIDKLFTIASLESISNMALYEDGDYAKRNALRLLVNMAGKADESKRMQVVSALVSSYRSGLAQGQQQQIRAIEFVKIVGQDSTRQLDSLIEQLIPGLIAVALSTDLTDSCQDAVTVANDFWRRSISRSTIDSEVLKILKSAIGSQLDKEKRYQMLRKLSKLFKKAGPESFSFDFLRDSVDSCFNIIVRIAILDDDYSIRGKAKQLLKQLAQNDHLSNKFNNDQALRCLEIAEEAAASTGSSNRAQNSAILVLETFSKQLDARNVAVFEKLIEWAGKDPDHDARLSSLKLISTICNHTPLTAILKESLERVLNGVAQCIEDEMQPIPTPKVPKAAHYCSKSETEDKAPAAAAQLKNDLIRNIDRFLDTTKTDLMVRLMYIQLLSALGGLKAYNPSDGILEKLAKAALTDTDSTIRSEAVNAISNLISQAQGTRDAPFLFTFKRLIPMFENPEMDTADQFQIEDADSPQLQILLDVASKDSQRSVRDEAAKALARIIRDANAEMRQSITAKLGKLFGPLISKPDSSGSAVSALAMMITADCTSKGFDHILCGHRRLVWIEIIILLGRTGLCDLQELGPKIIETGLEKILTDAPFPSLDVLFPKEIGLLEAIETILPKALDKSQKMGSDVRDAAVRLFTHLNGLRCSETCKWDQHTREGLVKNIDDERVVSRLADMAIKGAGDDVKHGALRVLKLAYAAEHLHQLQLTIKTSLQKVIVNALQDHGSRESRARAVEVTIELTNEGGQFRNIIGRPIISLLLKVILVDGDKKLRKGVETILFENLSCPTQEPEVNKDILIEIPPLLAHVTPSKGESIALYLTKTLEISSDTAADIAGKLTQTLRSASHLARATALEMLLSLYTRHRGTRPRLIESAIPEIVSLALEDKHNVLWEPAFRLLIALSTPPEALVEQGSAITQNIGRKSYRQPALSQIKCQMSRFMALLEHQDMRPLVIDLLSLVSIDGKIRQVVSLGIASAVFASGNTKLSVGLSELLHRLICDGTEKPSSFAIGLYSNQEKTERFKDEATDYMMLFLASALASTAPVNDQYRYKILTGLWCCYGSKTLDGSASETLVKWFTLALFGRHATTHEVTTWRSGCELWLQDELRFTEQTAQAESGCPVQMVRAESPLENPPS
ncbi:hypothetical protein EST38_g5335 [Candolleomyces aberdarensis]|uniref:Uncharacterized protein n=1 Tax=Candolleomyces aberdarensis TaxID=2316362 RepID=A0A4V1Q418_9AGAR|nr:hypothetical protein EST38_g5335 [Candolleomyces aberdarensis]